MAAAQEVRVLFVKINCGKSWSIDFLLINLKQWLIYLLIFQARREPIQAVQVFGRKVSVFGARPRVDADFLSLKVMNVLINI